MTPGVYPKMPMAEYLRLPAVSASIIKGVVDQCPFAGWHGSWLNPNPPPPDDDDGSDKGSIGHAILLEGSESCCEVIDPKLHPAEKAPFNIPVGWGNKSIRAARDKAREAGKIPILLPAIDEVRAMVRSAQSFIASLKDSDDALAVRVYEAFQPGGGESETTLVWKDYETLCRIRPDRLSADRKLIVDAKFTKTSAHPDAFGRGQLVKMGYHTSASFYRRGVHQHFLVLPDYVFLVIEQSPPYLCSLIGVDPHGLALGEANVEAGLLTWSRCVARNYWPAYPTRVCYPEFPTWLDARQEERDADEIWK